MRFIKEIGSQIGQIKAGKKQLRKFGLLMTAVCFVFAAVFWRREAPTGVYFFSSLALCFAAAGIFRPYLLFFLYKSWFGLSFVIGFFISRLILFVLYYLLITPVGLVLRFVKGDVLRQEINKNAASYWVERKTTAGLERQF